MPANNSWRAFLLCGKAIGWQCRDGVVECHTTMLAGVVEMIGLGWFVRLSSSPRAVARKKAPDTSDASGAFCFSVGCYRHSIAIRSRPAHRAFTSGVPTSIARCHRRNCRRVLYIIVGKKAVCFGSGETVIECF